MEERLALMIAQNAHRLRTCEYPGCGLTLLKPFSAVAKSSYSDFGVRWHDTAFLPGDMSPGSKARTCPRTPNKNFPFCNRRISFQQSNLDVLPKRGNHSGNTLFREFNLKNSPMPLMVRGRRSFPVTTVRKQRRIKEIGGEK